ncbi:MAG TPA: hypothetical protein VHX65_16515 [Pirellulales bacterium]|nr:hypothetical protein [Pirellulales bacterium]
MNAILFAGLALALLPWLVGADPKPPASISASTGKFQSLEVRQLLLFDDAGNKVGGLIGKKDNSNLTIKDSNGKNRIFVGMLKGNPSLLFADKDGDIVASEAERNGSFESVR